MKVVVTREHWDKADRELRELQEFSPGMEKMGKYCDKCVVAQALSAAGAAAPFVTSRAVSYNGVGFFKLPQVAIDLVWAFDHRHRRGVVPEFPIEFEIVEERT